MSLIYLYFIALGLSTKTFSVSVFSSALKPVSLQVIIKIALIFAIVQAILISIGLFAGLMFSGWLEQYRVALAFSLIAIVGFKMIIGTFKLKSRVKVINTESNIEILILAIATGIDIFIAGLALGLIESPVLKVFAGLGVIVFFMSIVGSSFGKKYPMKYGNLVELFGGLLLLFIGLRNLIGLMI